MNRTVDEIRDSVRAVLESEGMYSPAFELLIENLAQTTYLKDIAFEDATDGFGMNLDGSREDVGGRSVVFELSREGDRRYKVNPAYSVFMDMVHKCQNMLNELCMTAKSTTSTQDDEIDELKKKVEKAANGK